MSRDLTKKLRATFEYHPGGYLIRKSTGEPCGQRANHPDGYARVRMGRRELPAHRVIYAIVHGKMPKGGVKQTNGNRIDNRIENLREVSHSENRHNSKVYDTNTSGFPGVHWHSRGRKWHAQITVNNRKIHLGLFEDFEEAVRARKLAKIKYHPSSPEAAKFARELSLK